MTDDLRAPQMTASLSQPRLYPRLVGAAWLELDPVVQRVHADPALTHAEGIAQVSRAPGRLMGYILDAAQVPRSSGAGPVQLAVLQSGPIECWHRAFGGRPLVTHQSEAPDRLLAERIGILEFRFRLAVKHGALLFRQESFAICLGPLRLPLPDWLSIKIAAREGAAAGPDRVGDWTSMDLRVTAPTGNLLFAYRGTVHWKPGSDPS